MTAKRPAELHKKGRYIKVSDPLWRDAQRVAAARGETVSEVIRRALDAYVNRHDNT